MDADRIDVFVFHHVATIQAYYSFIVPSHRTMYAPPFILQSSFIFRSSWPFMAYFRPSLFISSFRLRRVPTFLCPFMAFHGYSFNLQITFILSTSRRPYVSSPLTTFHGIYFRPSYSFYPSTFHPFGSPSKHNIYKYCYIDLRCWTLFALPCDLSYHPFTAAPRPTSSWDSCTHTSWDLVLKIFIFYSLSTPRNLAKVFPRHAQALSPERWAHKKRTFLRAIWVISCLCTCT